MRVILLLMAMLVAFPACATDALDWSGFALLRAAGGSNELPLEDDQAIAQVQLGVDWRPSLNFGAHVHLLARGDDDHSRRGRAGVVEAYLQQSFERGPHRLRFMEGAFFLPGSRENVDALWESPYAMTSSALNSWLGEEFRPIGVDAAYTLNRRWTGGVTVYRGNDTFGALPAARGWKLHDHWTLLGEHVAVDQEYFTSVSAETDGNLGWAARGRWNNDRSVVQLTYIDNNSDAHEHGELANWETRFYVAGADFNAGDWTFAAEYGWGETVIVPENQAFALDISAGYALVSRRLGKGRATLRAEAYETRNFDKGSAVTAAFFWPLRRKIRAGIEGTVAEGEARVSAEVRYSFP